MPSSENNFFDPKTAAQASSLQGGVSGALRLKAFEAKMNV